MRIAALTAVSISLGTATAAVAETAGELATRITHTYSGKKYQRVRAELISQGFYPIKFKHNPNSWPCVDEMCDHYPEIVDCGGNTDVRCWFVWAGPEHSGYFLMETQGESRWSFNRNRPMHKGEIDEIKKALTDMLDDPSPGAPIWSYH